MNKKVKHKVGDLVLLFLPFRAAYRVESIGRTHTSLVGWSRDALPLVKRKNKEFYKSDAWGIDWTVDERYLLERESIKLKNTLINNYASR